MVLQGLLGLIFFLLLAWICSENRRRIPLRTVLAGVALQLLICALLLKVPLIKGFFLSLNRVILSLEQSTQAGTSMVFGYLGGAAAPFEVKYPEASFILAFRALPLVLLISALSSLLFYWRVLPVVVRGLSRLLQRTMGIGGAEGLGAAANIFLGMVESPLFVRPYLERMSRSEIFTLMTCGMATIAGTVMVLYASFLARTLPDALGHILVASVMNAPAAIAVSKIMIPDTGPPTHGELVAPEPALGAMDAVTKGTLQGVSLLINIAAMLVVLVALVHLANLMLGLLPSWDATPVTLQGLFGYLMAPVAWLMGLPWSEAALGGQLLGTKAVLNELIAYLNLSQVSDGTLSARSVIILTYALCGFANPGSLGIMIGGMGTMAPGRRSEIVSLGFRCLVSGTIATCMTGTVVGLLL